MKRRRTQDGRVDIAEPGELDGGDSMSNGYNRGPPPPYGGSYRYRTSQSPSMRGSSPTRSPSPVGLPLEHHVRRSRSRSPNRHYYGGGAGHWMPSGGPKGYANNTPPPSFPPLPHHHFVYKDRDINNEDLERDSINSPTYESLLNQSKPFLAGVADNHDNRERDHRDVHIEQQKEKEKETTVSHEADNSLVNRTPNTINNHNNNNNNDNNNNSNRSALDLATTSSSSPLRNEYSSEPSSSAGPSPMLFAKSSSSSTPTMGSDSLNRSTETSTVHSFLPPIPPLALSSPLQPGQFTSIPEFKLPVQPSTPSSHSSVGAQQHHHENGLVSPALRSTTPPIQDSPSVRGISVDEPSQYFPHLPSKEIIIFRMEDIDNDITLVEKELKSLQANLNKIDTAIVKLSHPAPATLAKAKKPSQPLNTIKKQPAKISVGTGQASATTQQRQLKRENEDEIYRENQDYARESDEMVLQTFDGDAPYPRINDLPSYQMNIDSHEAIKQHMAQVVLKQRRALIRHNGKLVTKYRKAMENFKKKANKMGENGSKNANNNNNKSTANQTFRERPALRSATTTRSGRRPISDAVHSEAEFIEIMDQLREQDAMDPIRRHIHMMAEVPPMLPQGERDLHYINFNGLLEDPVSVDKERRALVQWTDEEKEKFVKKYVTVVDGMIDSELRANKLSPNRYLQYPKKFSKISSFFENKTTEDMVVFYYNNKKKLNLKTMLQNAQLKKRTGKRFNAQSPEPFNETRFPWSNQERELFNTAFAKHGMDFKVISETIGSKTYSQCRSFYYNSKRKSKGDTGDSKRKVEILSTDSDD
ncbi:hypothetical protein SAMD00019534_107450 [Acytostelium subglobosum LB1]|uniref:hypothetical protein n=1 Tax=Acytostelium subglobosum LB1 TaxID=1410327 RepID=UPI000644C001|nr:hypothetical protein SAMD00019534_107450 [Acytostelium subglobosum LB1]GAM27569.1 hypothetical protein SAMD00019534_107450 [Acytostelium subglobosum LB1]|eukprot:XP_012749634.1 hypothetical protein SAMD00019534_107450 [Acytostelium subglobosum LB1]